MPEGQRGPLAVYPGTFDPVTNGHIDIIQRSLHMFGRLVVAVASRPNKPVLFNLKERVEMMREATRRLPGVEVEAFDGLLVRYLRAKKAVAIIRGLRAVSDFEYELQMALMNRRLEPRVETIFMMPSEEYSYLTSSVVKEVAGLGGQLRGLVVPAVARRLKEQFTR